ncbi:DUF3564 family protein [Caballeronia sp. BR00000012568055]|uniref:DUF3564 family protein n=1 Tax=Caballeronia sp. BR00000012568055 TaxID=2918761 RepID=UPI0023F994AE|nr:DUF3564 family protein [Caballeronia sp. BR00000012568055]
MRITVHLDTFDRVSPCAYAILNLDPASHRWHCSNQHGLHVPIDGLFREADMCLALYDLDEDALICELESFNMNDMQGPFEGETGLALWYGEQAIQPAAGHWHVDLVSDPAEVDTLDVG